MLKKESNEFINKLRNEFSEFTLIPEGGYHPSGAMGAGLITQFIEQNNTHICSAIGTATTIAGLLLSAKTDQEIIGVNVLKGGNDTNERISFLTKDKVSSERLTIINSYHFGGYAKHTPF
ncbi:MAG: hypothetical protein WDM71_10110 [Ferruginibacter sp.]